MRYRRQRLFALAARTTQALAISTLLLAGCAAPIAQLSSEIPRKAVPAAIDAGVGSLDDPAQRRRIERILASPELRNIQRDLIAGIVDATLTTFDEQARRERIDLLANKALSGTLAMLDKDLPDLGHDVTQGAVGGALDAALAPGRSAAIARQVGLVLDAGLASAQRAEIARGISAAMKDEIGPAVRATLRDQVAPGIAETLKNEELQRALGVTARNLGREVVLGVTEALGQRKPPPEAGSLLSSLSGLAQRGAQLFGSAAWVLVLVIAALFVWILKLLAQARRFREDADRRAANARLLEESLLSGGEGTRPVDPRLEAPLRKRSSRPQTPTPPK